MTHFAKAFITLLSILYGISIFADPTLLYEQDPTLLTTNIQIVIRTGSASDPKDKVGLAELLASLLTRGTQTLTRTEFQKKVEGLGGTLSGDAGTDNIVFSGEVIKENTQAFLDLMESMLLTPRLAPEEFDALKRETLASIAHIKNNNNRLAGLAIRKEFFAGTPLELPGNGSLTTVKNIQLQDLKKIYTDWFHQSNILFAVVSALPEESFTARIKNLAKRLPEGKYKPYQSIAPAIFPKNTLIVIQKPRTETGVVMMGQTGFTVHHPDRYVFETANYAFGGSGLTARLFKIIRGELGWTYSIGSTYTAMGALSDQQNLFLIYQTPSFEFTSKSLFKTLAMWQQYLQQGLLPQELKMAQESLINSYPFEFDTAAKRLAQRVYSHLYQVPILSQDKFSSEIGATSNQKLLPALAKQHEKQSWLVSIVGDKNAIQAQLDEEQRFVPKEERLTISKVVTPEQIIE